MASATATVNAPAHPSKAPAPVSPTRTMAKDAASLVDERRPPGSLLRAESPGFVVFVSDDCLAGAKKYDLLVHFHGLADVVSEEWTQAGVRGVLAVANAGAWSRDYRRVYGHSGVLGDVLSRVDEKVRELCPGAPSELRRLALGGFSAGYSVVRHILRDEGAGRVDAVLLSDGIHAGFSPTESEPRRVLAYDVEPFVEFGRLAVSGKKLFSITHSSIRPPDYASTTETTDYLLSELGVARTPADVGPLSGPSRDPRAPTTRADSGGLHVRGYEGEQAPDHVWQLRAMDATLFSDLKLWWER